MIILKVELINDLRMIRNIHTYIKCFFLFFSRLYTLTFIVKVIVQWQKQPNPLFPNLNSEIIKYNV